MSPPSVYVARLKALRTLVRWGAKHALLNLNVMHDITSKAEALACGTPACLAGWGMALPGFKRSRHRKNWAGLRRYLGCPYESCPVLFSTKRRRNLSDLEEAEWRLGRAICIVKLKEGTAMKTKERYKP